MKRLKWLPLRYIIRKAAQSQGFLDPIELMARLRSLAQPSEVGEPIELLRAGVVFHARGLINSKVIQHNLDWVWPYWIEKQYDPHDCSFIPRAFSVTHINLTHRNWTAIGYPDVDTLPIVDPRGLLTPFIDGWSIDACVLGGDGRMLLPSRTGNCRQYYSYEEELSVVTELEQDGIRLRSEALVVAEQGRAVCKLKLAASCESGEPCTLLLLLRPANPEGVSFIHEASIEENYRQWLVNKEHRVYFDRPAASHHASNYPAGDVLNSLDHAGSRDAVDCDVGLATAAARFAPAQTSELTVSIPLQEQDTDSPPLSPGAWPKEKQTACRLRCPEPRYQDLYDNAVHSLILHSPKDVYPGPYTYKRFWFRDAAYIIHALLCLNLKDRASRAIAQFPQRQTSLGYFRSQEGEWDSNGEVLWLLRRYELLCNITLGESWHNPILKGARWISNKRLDDDLDGPHAGLLPAGFSAEHLGPNDYYYWDDFWGIAGLDAAAELLAGTHPEESRNCSREAESFRRCVDSSLRQCAERLGRPAMPASPYRRLDAGAIGSIALGYPLQLCPPDDARLTDCVDYLVERSFVDGAFFQDMIHSGLNAYLTLQIAQVMLRNRDPRWLELMDTTADLATSTGQWPEAIHPQTKGGCMGDGHHVWAAAEWALLQRNCFVLEETDRLVLCAGIPRRWLDSGETISFGPTPTQFGPLSVRIIPGADADGSIRVEWQAEWYREKPAIEIALGGYETLSVGDGEAVLRRAAGASAP